MSKYKVSCTWGCCVEREIEADSQEQAEDKFFNDFENQITFEEFCDGQWYNRPDVEEIGDDED